MAKDKGGHGSESRGGSSFDNINAQRKAQGFQPMPEKNRGMHDFFDYMAGSGPKPDFMNAASAVVGSGPKSAPVETHPAMSKERADFISRMAADGRAVDKHGILHPTDL